jgi:hypothetical protein
MEATMRLFHLALAALLLGTTLALARIEPAKAAVFPVPALAADTGITLIAKKKKKPPPPPPPSGGLYGSDSGVSEKSDSLGTTSAKIKKPIGPAKRRSN